MRSPDSRRRATAISRPMASSAVGTVSDSLTMENQTPWRVQASTSKLSYPFNAALTIFKFGQARRKASSMRSGIKTIIAWASFVRRRISSGNRDSRVGLESNTHCGLNSSATSGCTQWVMTTRGFMVWLQNLKRGRRFADCPLRPHPAKGMICAFSHKGLERKRGDCIFWLTCSLHFFKIFWYSSRKESLTIRKDGAESHGFRECGTAGLPSMTSSRSWIGNPAFLFSPLPREERTCNDRTGTDIYLDGRRTKHACRPDR